MLTMDEEMLSMGEATLSVEEEMQDIETIGEILCCCDELCFH